VDPRCQQSGVEAALCRHAIEEIRASGVGLVVLAPAGTRGTHRPGRSTSRSASARTASSGNYGAL